MGSDDVVNIAFPVGPRVSVPSRECSDIGVPSKNDTVPVGDEPDGTGGVSETLAVRTTGKPSTDGLGHEVRIVEVFRLDWTTCSSTGEVESEKLPSVFVKIAVIGWTPITRYAGGVHVA